MFGRLTTITYLSLCLVLATAWWDKGHMLTAQIAYNHLSDTHEYTSLNSFAALISAFNNLTDGRTNTFAQSAVWPDDLKGYGADQFSQYHFTNIVYDPDFTFKGMNQLQVDINSINIIGWCKTVLSSNKNGISFERAFMARYLLHCVGDLHQPLHNTNFFNNSEQLQSGDLGGNKFTIKLAPNNKTMNMHSFFDSIALFQDPDKPIKRPLNHSETEKLEREAKELMREYPFSSLQDIVYGDQNPHNWAVETYQIAVEHIYKHIAHTDYFSQQYIDKSRDILRRQVALGGYRLANIIKNIYASAK